MESSSVSYLDVSKLDDPKESEIYVLRQLEKDGIIFLQHLYQYCRRKTLPKEISSLITLYLDGSLLGDPFPQLDCFQSWNVNFSFTLQVQCLTWLDTFIEDDNNTWAFPLIKLLFDISNIFETKNLLTQCIGWLQQPFIKKVFRHPNWWARNETPSQDYHQGRQKIEEFTKTCWGLLLLHPFKHQLFENINWELSFELCEILMKDKYIRPLFLDNLMKFVEQFHIYTQTGHVLQTADQMALQMADPNSHQYSCTVKHMQLGYAIFQIMLQFWEKSQKSSKLTTIPLSHCNKDPTELTFMEQCFFLSHKCFQTCFVSYLELIKEVCKRSIMWQQRVTELSTEPPNSQNSLMINFLKMKISLLNQRVKSLYAYFENKTLSNRLTYFMEDTAFWLWSHRSEDMIQDIYYLENIIQYVDCYQRSIISYDGGFMIKFPEVLTPPQSIFNIISVYFETLRNNKFCTNPHLKMKIIDFMYFLAVDADCRSNDGPRPMLHRYLRREERMIPCLIHFGVELEQTGDHNQFYQKFHPRYQICCIISYLWIQPDLSLYYSGEILRETQQNHKLWVQFVFLLLNDYNYVLDEALTGLNKIHQREIDNQENQIDEKMIHNYLVYSQEYLMFMNKLSHTNPKIFTELEVMEKWVQIFMFYFQKLTGSSSIKYKVEDAIDKYRFNPLILIQNMADIFTIFQDWGYSNNKLDELIPVMISDDRFSMSVFDNLLNLLIRKKCFGNKLWNKMSKLEKIKKRLEMYKSENIDYDQYDPPEELCDPILNTLMKDPVMLPSSNTMVDKSMIKKHLMSDKHDPFNRNELTLEGIETHNTLPEIQIHIEEFTQKVEKWKQTLQIPE